MFRALVIVAGDLSLITHLFKVLKLIVLANSAYDKAKLHLRTPMDFGGNSTPFSGAAAFCLTKIGDFRRRPQK